MQIRSVHCKEEKREERHRERHRAHVRQKRDDAQHATRTAILLCVLAILTSLIVGQAYPVVTSTTLVLTLPLLSTPSLYKAAPTEVPPPAFRVLCFIYLHLKFRFCEVLYPFDLLVDLLLRCLFLEVHLLTFP